ncbi:hypothetical protein [Actinomycetospora termitidis]|uniref:Uncharacterized protein n=1 Tax=Actinomycetospora termitidis TaxID=3053470 RepID=A0ABT7MIU4_9PSEU|nr:hypothetical protein [Actinomycetospora sp. Odt1-22]MDL5160599.1 hypothetical protein [Actinomycetospora sp. Odt1-22]
MPTTRTMLGYTLLMLGHALLVLSHSTVRLFSGRYVRQNGGYAPLVLELPCGTRQRAE